MRRVAAIALLGGAIAAGCDRPFEPFAENLNGPFSMVGYLDLKTDTQWVRVMPVRQSLLSRPEPIDAVVTLERVGGRTVTLRDSLFTFQDARLDGVAYAHVYWTTERLEASARYRVRATRSDGAASSVVVDMPRDLELTLLNAESGRDTAWLEVRAEKVQFVETFHLTRTTTGEPAGSVGKRQRALISVDSARMHVGQVDGVPPFNQGLVDVGRAELRVATTKADWPAVPRLPITLADVETMPSNVENGLGYVGAAASWTIPFPRCTVLMPRSENSQTCAILHNVSSASISGRLIRQPCARPHALGEVRLTERFAGGGAVMRRWRAGWDGSYRFEGIEPGSELVLEVRGAPNVPVAAPLLVPLPRLAPGQRHAVQDISVAVISGC